MRHPFVWIALAALWLPHPALAARTVAVLPLEQGGGSEEFAGLGSALAGMLVSDLSRTEALQLVERSRLDDLIAEIELTESGFLDPTTAQQLGRGLGAELVVVGSYSVVTETFLLDARIVEVASGAVLRAVDAQGTIEDFVTVEKDLVEALLDGLEVEVSSSVRRKLLADAPTESFPAFSAYGEGLASQAAGRIEEARGSFERALEIDPEFIAAREAIAALRSLVESEKERAARSKADRRAAIQNRVLDEVPDIRTVGDDVRYDIGETARLALRWMILDELELHCQRYEEMWHYLDRVDWTVATPPAARGHDLFETTMLTAIEMELIEHPGRLRTIPFDRPSVASMPGLFYRSDRFVLDLDQGDPGNGKSRGLLGAMFACQPPAEQLETLEEIQRRLHAAGVADIEPDSDTYAGVTLDDHMESIWTLVHARHLGVDAEVQQRAEALVAKHTEGYANTWAVRRTERVVREGDGWEKRHAQRQGLDSATLIEVARATAAGEGGPIRWENSYCAKASELHQRQAESGLTSYEKDLARDDPAYADWSLARLGSIAAPLLDLGCLEGHAGTLDDAYAVYAWVGTAPQRLRADMADSEDCQAALAQLPNQVNPANLDSVAQMDGMLEQYAVQALDWYYRALVVPRCVESPR